MGYDDKQLCKVNNFVGKDKCDDDVNDQSSWDQELMASWVHCISCKLLTLQIGEFSILHYMAKLGF